MGVEIKLELRDAVDAGDLNEVRRLFEPSDLECNEYSGNENLLHYAAGWSTLEVVKFLVESGADVNQLSGGYRAPALTYAADRGKLDIVRYLVESGTTFDLRGALRNPLFTAAREGHLEVVEYLISVGIDRHACYRYPSGALENALTIARQRRRSHVVDFLKQHGCREPVEGVDVPLNADRKVNTTPSFQRGQSIIQYMEERFGPADTNGMQELLPLMDGISVTINVIRPNEVHPYLVLFTNGMSDLPMKVPKGKEAWRYAELVMHLPPDWVHPADAKGDAKWMWPALWLRKIAYFPHMQKTWLGTPATIVASDSPPVPLGPNTQQSCLFLLPDHANLSPPLKTEQGHLIRFYTVVPIYAKEREYELKHGMKPFLHRLVEHEVPMTVEINRPSFA